MGRSQAENQVTAKVAKLWSPFFPFHCQFCSATRIVFRFRSLCPCHHHLISSHLSLFRHHIFWSFSCLNDRVSVELPPSSVWLLFPRLLLHLRLPLPVYCSFVSPLAFATLLSLVYGFALCFILVFFSLFSSPSLASFLIWFFFPDFSFSCLYLLIAPLLHQL